MNSTHGSSTEASSSHTPLFSRADSSKTQDTGLTLPDSEGGEDGDGSKNNGAGEAHSANTLNSTNTRHHHHPRHKHSTGNSSPKVVYGAGAVARLPTELGKLGLSAPLIVSSPSRLSLARKVQALIPNLDTRILDSALVNVPQQVVDDAVARVTGCDSVISVGGSSAMRLAKAVAAKKGFPHICIPTTYSGSESLLLGDVRRRKSKGQRHRSDTGGSTSSRKSHEDDTQTMPEMIIYDEDLTSTTTSMVISAPNDTKPPASGCSSMDDDTQWSYISLPGV